MIIYLRGLVIIVSLFSSIYESTKFDLIIVFRPAKLCMYLTLVFDMLFYHVKRESLQLISTKCKELDFSIFQVGNFCTKVL